MQPVRRLFSRHSNQHTISPRSHAEFPCCQKGGAGRREEQFRYQQLGCDSQSNAEQTLPNLSPFTRLFLVCHLQCLLPTISTPYTVYSLHCLLPTLFAPYTVCWLQYLLVTLSASYTFYWLHC
ncbi:hypothetical protein E2C01_077594 [Portunus trituberculatus]|uniref:Uncharacterized protein n=1 Tax=Portunus trituberculatus TaxID=210409 RepID=A0A5B7IKP0_PORTR|nr:hypothetical protein [Portunus trituberculatus]